MLEAAVDDGAEEFGLEEEVPEAGAVNGDVTAFDVRFDGLLRLGSRRLLRLLFLVVIQQVVHDFGHGSVIRESKKLEREMKENA